MPSGLAIARLSVSQNAQSRPFAKLTLSAMASIKSSRPGNQRREQGVKISTGLFDLFGCDGKTFAVRAIASQVLRIIEVGDIDFNEDPIAGGVRQNFEGLLLAVERVSVQSRRVLEFPLMVVRRSISRLKKSSLAGST